MADLYKTLEQFFETLFEQSKDIQERIAIHLVKDGHILPEKLIGLTWTDIDLKSKAFHSTDANLKNKIRTTPK